YVGLHVVRPRARVDEHRVASELPHPVPEPDVLRSFGVERPHQHHSRHAGRLPRRLVPQSAGRGTEGAERPPTVGGPVYDHAHEESSAHPQAHDANHGGSMRKIINSTYVSLDGVIENPQNWTSAYFQEEAAAYAQDLLFSCGALLMGRRTYDGFAEAWPAMEESTGEFGVRMNTYP